MPRAKIATKNPPLQSNDVVSAVPGNDTKSAVKQTKTPVKYALVEPRVADRLHTTGLSQFTLPVIALLITASFGLTAMLGSAKHAVSAHVARTENAVATLSVVSKPPVQNTAANTVAPATAVHPQQELFAILNKE